VAAEALEQSMLESKDKEQLLAIAQALGIKTTSRAAKATLIDKILETTSGGSHDAVAPAANGRAGKAAKEAAPEAARDDRGRHSRGRRADAVRRSLAEAPESQHRSSGHPRT
jgi:hypothetical protein